MEDFTCFLKINIYFKNTSLNSASNRYKYCSRQEECDTSKSLKEKYEFFLRGPWNYFMAGSIIELSKYRYERALEELKNAKEVFDAGSYKLALNRSYYAIHYFRYYIGKKHHISV